MADVRPTPLSDAAGAIAFHAADGTNVHGIVDASRLVTIDNIGVYAPPTDLSVLVTLTPANTARNTVVSQAAGASALVLKMAAAASADPLSIQTSAGAVVAKVSVPGDATLLQDLYAGRFVRSGHGTANSVILGYDSFNGVPAPAFALGQTYDALIVRTALGELTQKGAGGATSMRSVLRQVAAQTASPFEVQTSAGGVVFAVSAAGGVNSQSDVSAVGSFTSGTNRLQMGWATGIGYAPVIGFGTAEDAVLHRTAAGEITQKAQGAATSARSILKMVASQATNPFEVQDSAAAVQAAITSAGNLKLTPGGVTVGSASGYGGVWLGQATPTITNYALLNAGDMCVNAPTGNRTVLRVNNADVLAAAAAGVTVTGDLIMATAGKGLKLKSPDGLTTKTLTINNAGAIALI